MFLGIMRYGPDYANARQMQTALMKKVCDEKSHVRDVVQCVRAWRELEQLKREIRGIPPLAPATLKEMADLKLARMRQINSAPFTVPFTEPD